MDLIVCKCRNVEHQLVFEYDKDDNQLYMYVHLVSDTFWQRLKNGIKHIFGYKCKYGNFDEFIFNKEDLPELKKIINQLEK